MVTDIALLCINRLLHCPVRLLDAVATLEEPFRRQLIQLEVGNECGGMFEVRQRAFYIRSNDLKELVSKASMAEVAYGQFCEVVEDVAYPLAEANQQEAKPVRASDWTISNELIRDFFRAMETVNNSQLDPSQSTGSLTASGSTLDSNSYNQLRISPSTLLGALQAATLNESTASLGSYDDQDAENVPPKVVMPAAVRQFLTVVDEFMHNHDTVEEPGPHSPQRTAVGEYPKFC